MNLQVFITFNGLVTTYNQDEEVVESLSGDIRLLHDIFELEKDSKIAKQIIGTTISKLEFFMTLKDGEETTNYLVKKAQIKQLSKYIIDSNSSINKLIGEFKP